MKTTLFVNSSVMASIAGALSFAISGVTKADLISVDLEMLAHPALATGNPLDTLGGQTGDWNSLVVGETTPTYAPGDGYFSTGTSTMTVGSLMTGLGESTSVSFSWIDRWRATQLPFIHKQEGRVVLMLVVFRGRNADTLALVDCTHPGDRISRKPIYFNLCRIMGDAPTIRATRAAVTGKVAMSLVQRSWSLVENAPLDAQEINAATDEHEIWYLFARKLENGSSWNRVGNLRA